MGVYQKPLDLYKAQLARFQKANLTMVQGHTLITYEGLNDARELTSGRLTPSQTAGAFARGASPALSTPAGRRRVLTPRQIKGRGLGKTGAPLLPINIQSGRLHDSFRLVRQKIRSNSQIVDLTQTDPGGGRYTLLPGGTRKMVRRGFSDELKKRWRPRNAAFVDHFRASLKRV